MDGSGSAFVTGPTGSADYPTTQDAFDTSLSGPDDAFVTKLNVSGSELAYSTLLGGTSGEGGRGIAVRNGKAYVTGFTDSTDYSTTTDAFDAIFNGNLDAYVTKLNASGSELAYSTFLGGTNPDAGSDIAVQEDRAYVTGETQSAGYPTTQGAFDTSYNEFDAFVTKLPTG